MTNFFHKLITNNNGFSTKNFILLVGTGVALLAVIAFMTLLYLDFFMEQKTLSINLATYALVVTAIEGIIAVLFGLKVWSERYEKH